MSSRLETSLSRRSAWASTSSASSLTSSGLRRGAAFDQREADSFIVANGVRRSCETAPTRARRSVSTSSRRRARTASSRSRPLSRARARWLAKARQQLLLGLGPPEPRTASKPMGCPGGHQGHGLELARLGAAGPQVDRCPALADSRPASCSDRGAPGRSRHLQPPSAPGRRRETPSRSKPDFTELTIVSSSSGAGSSRTSSSDRLEQPAHLGARRSGFGLGQRWPRPPPGDQDHHHRVDAEGYPVLGPVDVEGVVRGQEDEVVDEEARGRGHQPGVEPAHGRPRPQPGTTRTSAGRGGR